MSRVGKKAVIIPAGVSATLSENVLQVSGAKGKLYFNVPSEVTLTLSQADIKVTPIDLSKDSRSKWGMSRAMIANLVKGVSNGFQRKLEITGVGYKAAVSGKVLKLSLGYSHDVDYDIPDGVSVATPKPTEIVLSGIDKQLLGQVASEIRSYRPPEPYKGKGVRYEGEFIFRKEGKKK